MSLYNFSIMPISKKAAQPSAQSVAIHDKEEYNSAVYSGQTNYIFPLTGTAEPVTKLLCAE